MSNRLRDRYKEGLTFGVMIIKEDFENIDMLRAGEWITTNADAK